jgi:pimeloyl-ACP methyl ester carboxylesterase
VDAAARTRSRRRAAIVATAVAAVAALPFGCAVFAPSFAPTDLGAGLVERGVGDVTVAGPVGPVRAVVTPRRPRTVLFVHGTPGTWEAFRGYLADPELAGRARLIAVDRPGFGRSGRGRAVGSLETQAAALAAVLEGTASGPAVVVGHSLGGPIAARLAADRPELVAGLVLVAPSIDPALERWRWYNVAASWRVVQWLLPVDWVTSNRELAPLAGELERLRPLWHRIAAPVVVVQGGRDELVPAANADFAERVLPAPRLEVRRHPEDGHFILWQRPETVRGPILDLLERTAPAPEPAR